MNCFFHPAVPAVSQCVECGKGLCVSCATQYSISICRNCNHARAGNELKAIRKELGMSIGAGLVFALGAMSGGLMAAVVTFYCVASLVVGWFSVGAYMPRLSSLYTIFFFRSTVIYWLIKVVAAFFIGLLLLPFRTVKNFKRLKELNKL